MGGIAFSTTALPWIQHAWMRGWILLLCGTLAAQPVWSQNAGQASSTNPEPETLPHHATPNRLQIKVLSPTPLNEPAGALSANHLTVQVVDGFGMPVPRAAVSFRLPEAGPGGVFLNGLSTEVAITDAHGKASVQGFDWRAETGTSFLHVIAAYGSLRAGAMVEVQLRRGVADQPPTAVSARPKQTPSTSSAHAMFSESAHAMFSESAHAMASESAPLSPSAASFPLPPEASLRPAAKASPASEPSRQSARESFIKTLPRAPRTMEPEEAPPVPATVATITGAPRVRRSPSNQQQTEAETTSYVTVKRSGGGANRMVVLLVVAAAAAGGALAAGMAKNGSSGPSSTPSAPGLPAITIGSPTISVTGGTN